MTNSKSKFYFLIALVLLALLSTACNDSDNTVTPTPEPTAPVITGDVTADAIIEDTQEAVSKTVSALCSLCRFNESGENGDMSKCSSVCEGE